jgi:hypothetical protein
VRNRQAKYDMAAQQKQTPAGVFIVSYSYVDTAGQQHTVEEQVIGYSSKNAISIIRQYLSECNYLETKILDVKLLDKIMVIG